MPDSAPDTTHGRQCVLLFGMPRSGTTWLGKLFDSHPHVLYRHEPDTWRPVRITDGSDADRETLHTFMASLPAIRALRVSGKRPLFPKAWMSKPAAHLTGSSVELARVMGRIYPSFPVLFHPSGDRDPERVVVWKSIQSLESLGTALRILDKAKGVHLVRHPCGYVSSILRGVSSKNFTDNSIDWQAYVSVKKIVGTSLGDRFGFDKNFEKVLNSLSQEERLAWRWVVTNEKTFLEASQNERSTTVYYEDICRSPLASLEKLFDFVCLPMHQQTREFVVASTSHSNDSYYSIYKDPSAAAWRWQQELDSSTVDRIMAIVALSDVGQPYIGMTSSERYSG